jgi:predicted MFS family arabinose efflux permease
MGLNKMKNKIPISIAILSIIAYGNQGLSSLPDQCLYYLLRENWGLNAATLGWVSWVTGLAWYCKILFGWIADKFNDTKRTLAICYSLMLLTYLFIIFFGLNLLTIIVTGLLINFCIAQSDVVVDKQMVMAEQEYKLQGRLQSVQWTALGVAGLVVALGGAWVAKYFPDHINYRIAYGFAGTLPIAMLVYLFTKYKEQKRKTKKLLVIKGLKSKRFIIGLLFIACLNFAPSFGTALMIRVREHMGVDKMFLGYLGAMGTVLGIIGYAIYYKWAYKFPMKKMLIFMVIFTAITNLFYLYLPNQWVLALYNLAFGAVGGVTFMTLLAFFITIIPKGSEAIFYAIITSVHNFTARGGNFFGGIIYDKFGYSSTVVLSSAFTIVCLAFIPMLQIKGDKQ